MSENTLTLAVDAAAKFRAEFWQQHGKTPEDAIALAVAMMQQAEMIFRELGGGQMAAEQFYGAADRMAAPQS